MQILNRLIVIVILTISLIKIAEMEGKNLFNILTCDEYLINCVYKSKNKVIEVVNGGQQFDAIVSDKLPLGNSNENEYLLTKFERLNKVLCMFKCQKTSQCEYVILYSLMNNNEFVCVLANEKLASYLSSPNPNQQNTCPILDSFQVHKKKR